MKTAILYTRVSTEEQVNGYSLEFQEDLLNRYCAMQDIQIYQHFREEGKSAKDFNRPKFQEMLAYLKRHHKAIDYVLYTKWDRFSRSSLESLAMIKHFQSMGVEPQAIQQPIDFSIPQNKLMLAFYLTEPEVNNDVRAMATKEGLRKIKEKGGWVVHAPVGYELVRSPEGLPTLQPSSKAPIIREAFEMIAQGETQKQVRKFLRANGCPNSKNYVHRILTSQVYIGLIYVEAYKKESAKFVEGLHDPIIDPDLFHRVQKALQRSNQAKQKKSRLRPELPLRGHLKCKSCGKNLTGTRSRGKAKTVHYYYYICQHGCKERFPAHEANEAFEHYLRCITPKDDVVQLYKAIMQDIFRQKGDSQDNQICKVKEEIEALRAKLLKADELYIEGKLIADRYEAVSVKYRKELADLETQFDQLQDLGTNYTKYLQFSFEMASWLDRLYMGADVATKSKFMGCVFPHSVIYLGDGKYATPQANQVIELFAGLEADFEAAKAKKLAISDQLSHMGTQGGTRTRTPSLTQDFESSASTIPPPRHVKDLKDCKDSALERAFPNLAALEREIFILLRRYACQAGVQAAGR